MPLSRGLALAIVGAVAADPECNRRINSPIGSILPSRLGWAGSVRNYGYALVGTYAALPQGKYSAQPTKEQDDLVCYGIRDATMDAIKAAIKKAKPGDSLKTISEVSYVVRDNPIVHTATLIVMSKTSAYVFDWHATLDTGNPMMYPSAEAFDKGEGSVTFAKFTNFP